MTARMVASIAGVSLGEEDATAATAVAAIVSTAAHAQASLMVSVYRGTAPLSAQGLRVYPDSSRSENCRQDS